MANYTAYELADGAALDEIEELVRDLTDNGQFNDDSQPSGSAVARWITLAYYEVQAVLAAAGYDLVQTAAPVVGLLQELNVYMACVKIELSNATTGSNTFSGAPNDRLQVFRERCKELEEIIRDKSVLEVMGATRGGSATNSDLLEVTGVSKSDKLALVTDADFVPHRFKRGMQRNLRDSDQITSDLDRENPN